MSVRRPKDLEGFRHNKLAIDACAKIPRQWLQILWDSQSRPDNCRSKSTCIEGCRVECRGRGRCRGQEEGDSGRSESLGCATRERNGEPVVGNTQWFCSLGSLGAAHSSEFPVVSVSIQYHSSVCTTVLRYPPSPTSHIACAILTISSRSKNTIHGP